MTTKTCKQEKRHWRRYLACILCVVAVAVWFAPAYTVGLFGKYLLVDETPQKSDAIIILLGGREPDRLLKAVRLYNDGFAPVIAFASGFLDPEILKNIPLGLEWGRSSDQNVRALRSIGYSSPNVVVIPGDGAYDTSTELEAVALYAQEHKWQRLLLVSSPSHTRRLSIIWRRVSGGIPATTVASDVPGYSEWWKYGHHRRSVAYEYVSLVKEVFSQMRFYLSGEQN